MAAEQILYLSSTTVKTQWPARNNTMTPIVLPLPLPPPPPLLSPPGKNLDNGRIFAGSI